MWGGGGARTVAYSYRRGNGKRARTPFLFLSFLVHGGGMHQFFQLGICVFNVSTSIGL